MSGVLVLGAVRPAGGQILNFTTYGHAQGLPQAQVTALHQDRDGFLWIGSNSGLSRYDGRAFHAWTVRDGLRDNSITDMAGIGDTLYVASPTGGVCALWSGQVVACLGAEDGLPGEWVNHLFVGRGDTLWTSGPEGLASVSAGRVVRTFTTRDGLPSDNVLSAWETGGSLWVSTAGGLAVRSGERFRTGVSTVAAGPWAVALPTAHGVYLAGAAGLVLLDGEHAQAIEVPGLAPSAVFADGAVDDSDVAWFATTDGIVVCDGAEARRLTAANGLPAQPLTHVLADREGNIWFGSDFGLVKLTPGPFQLFDPTPVLSNAVARAIGEDSHGRIWVGTRRGVAMLEGDRFRAVRIPPALPNPNIRALSRTPDGGMLVGTRTGIVYYRPDGTARVYGLADGLPTLLVSTLVADSTGVFVGTSGGLVRWERGTLRPMDVPELEDAFIVIGRLDPRGRLWLGMLMGGVIIVGPDGVERLGPSEGLTDQSVWDIRFDDNGRAWVGTNGDGVFIVDGSNIRQITTRNGLVDDFVWSTLPDSRGNVWLFTSNGLERVLPDGNIRHYGPGQGLIDPEGAVAAALEGRDGMLWFGSASGVYRYDPAEDTPEILAPPIYVEVVSAGGRNYPITGGRLPPRPGVVNVRFVSPTFHDERAVRFRYRLAGVDSTWSAPVPDNTVALAGLGPGTYSFEVEAVNGSGTWSTTPAKASFRVLPAFYQTGWFAFLALLSAGGLLVTVPVLRVRRAERERARLEVLVQEHTRELEVRARRLEEEIDERQRLEDQLIQSHRMETAGRIAGGVAHEFNNLLTSVLANAQLLAEEKPDDGPFSEGLTEIEDAAERGRKLVSHLLGFSRLQPVREQAVDLGEIVTELRGLIVPLAGTRVSVDIQVEEYLPSVRFDPEHLKQIVMNLTRNAVEAMSADGSLTIGVGRLKLTSPRVGARPDEAPAGTYVTLSVADTGSGMSTNMLSRAFEPFFTTKKRTSGPGLGLSVVYGSVHKFGGYVEVQSTPGLGTTIRVLLPVAS